MSLSRRGAPSRLRLKRAEMQARRLQTECRRVVEAGDESSSLGSLRDAVDSYAGGRLAAWIADADGLLVHANDAFEKVTGFGRHECLGVECTRVMSLEGPGGADENAVLSQAILSQSSTSLVLFDQRTKAGEDLALVLALVPVVVATTTADETEEGCLFVAVLAKIEVPECRVGCHVSFKASTTDSPTHKSASLAQSQSWLHEAGTPGWHARIPLARGSDGGGVGGGGRGSGGSGGSNAAPGGLGGAAQEQRAVKGEGSAPMETRNAKASEGRGVESTGALRRRASEEEKEDSKYDAT